MPEQSHGRPESRAPAQGRETPPYLDALLPVCERDLLARMTLDECGMESGPAVGGFGIRRPARSASCLDIGDSRRGGFS